MSDGTSFKVSITTYLTPCERKKWFCFCWRNFWSAFLEVCT